VLVDALAAHRLRVEQVDRLRLGGRVGGEQQVTPRPVAGWTRLIACPQLWVRASLASVTPGAAAAAAEVVTKLQRP